MKNRRLNLCVSASLVDRFYAEVDFLNISTRTVAIEERELKSQADLIRYITELFINRQLEGISTNEPVDLEEDSKLIPFYCDKRTEGLWNVALKNGVASSYNQLAETALYYYFLRQESIARKVKAQILQVKEQLKGVQELAS
jgi:hypothetical protein